MFSAECVKHQKAAVPFQPISLKHNPPITEQNSAEALIPNLPVSMVIQQEVLFAFFPSRFCCADCFVCVCVCVILLLLLSDVCLHVLRHRSDVVPREHSGQPVTRPLPPVGVRVVQNLHQISASEPEFAVLLRVEIE